MAYILIAESGSTKTDWVLLHQGKKKRSFQSSGINPYLQNEQLIGVQLQEQCAIIESVAAVYFYGAGINGRRNQQIVSKALSKHFQCEKVSVESDMLAAARGLCQDQKGMVCILGTGSNACYYDGRKIKDQLPSLGFIAGDEGSGNHMGKRILQYYAYKTFDEELMDSFAANFESDLSVIIEKLYKQPFPNRYLASFVPFLSANRGHFMVENIIEDCLNDFFHQQLFRYRHSWKHPIFFTGSIAFVFQDILKSLCAQYELELGTILKNPLEGLIAYHRQ